MWVVIPEEAPYIATNRFHCPRHDRVSPLRIASRLTGLHEKSAAVRRKIAKAPNSFSWGPNGKPDLSKVDIRALCNAGNGHTTLCGVASLAALLPVQIIRQKVPVSCPRCEPTFKHEDEQQNLKKKYTTSGVTGPGCIEQCGSPDALCWTNGSRSWTVR